MKSSIFLIIGFIFAACTSPDRSGEVALREIQARPQGEVIFTHETENAKIELFRSEIDAALKYCDAHKLVDEASLLESFVRRGAAGWRKPNANMPSSSNVDENSLTAAILDSGHALVTNKKTGTIVNTVISSQMRDGRTGRIYAFMDGERLFEFQWGIF